MEFLTSDHATPTDAVHFPDNLTSFPRYSKADIPYLEINPHNPEFLQVNYAGHHFSNSSKDLDQNLLSCGDELEFLAQLACSDGHDLFKVNRAADQNDGGGGSPALVPMRTDDSNTEHRDINSQASFLEADSSDDDCKVSEASGEALNQEKKRTKMPKLKVFLKNLISQVMQKQEQMHKQLIDIVEKKEKERIILEEAWKKQETERAKVDEEERKQETLRSLALISFIQKLCYQDIEIPHSFESSDRGNDNSGIQKDNCLKDGSSNRRWPKTEVQALITVRMAVDQKFLLKGAKGSGWREVATGLSNMGYKRTPEKCREKWENINKYYRRTMESGKKRQRSLPYFDELDLIYKKGLVSQGNPIS